jgi:CRP-like cAMP-binding protein
MNLNDLGKLLCDLSFLDGAEQVTCRTLADVARVQDIAADTVLFREGQEAGAVFLVVSGQLALEIASPNRGRLRFQTVGPGELLGWSPLLGQPRMTATARALTAAQVIRLEAGPLLKLCEEQPRFGMEMMRRVATALSRRLAATRLHLLDVYRQELPVSSGTEGQA